MKRLLQSLLAAACLLLALPALPALAQSLTSGQLVTVRAAACADATAKTYVNAGNVPSLTGWTNAASATDAWRNAATQTTLFEATDVTKFDGLTAGKRDAWKLLMENTPIDFGRAPMRKAVQDVWGNTDSITVLQALLEKATNAQAAIGGTSKTTNTVAGIDRTYQGAVGVTDATRLIYADNGTAFTCP